MLDTDEKRVEWVKRILIGDFSESELVKLVRDELITYDDLTFIHDRNWSIGDVVYGRNKLSTDLDEAEGESVRIQMMFDDWNRKIGESVFGYGFYR